MLAHRDVWVAAMNRQNELANIEPSRHTFWLAGQIDEVETHAIDRLASFGEKLDSLTTELATTRESMNRASQRVVVSLLSASVTLLLSVVTAVIAGWVG